MLAIQLPEDIEERLDALAKATGRTKTFYAQQAILEHIGELETRARAELLRDPAEDPFGSFSEWDSDADRRAYGNL